MLPSIPSPRVAPPTPRPLLCTQTVGDPRWGERDAPLQLLPGSRHSCAGVSARVCLHVCVFVCMCICVCAFMCVYAHLSMCAHLCLCMCVRVHEHTCAGD